MAQLTYEEFRNEIKDNIKSYLTEEYADYSMEFQQVHKAGYEYEGLIIRSNDKVTATPTLNITKAYNDYTGGMDVEDIFRSLADIRMNAFMPSNSAMTDIVNYKKIKDRIVPRLLNIERNAVYLADKVYRKVADLAIVYSIVIFEDKNGTSSATVSSQLADTWGVDAETIHEQAMQNLKKQPFFFADFETSIYKRFEASVDIDDLDVNDYDLPIFILSNKNKVNGAVMVINPVCMDKIAKKIGRMYVLPSSTNEVIIIPKNGIKNEVERLRNMVRDINMNEVSDEEVLSDNVYEYDIESHSIKIAK